MLPAPDVCERARLSRDPRFDGRFYVGVVTTGVYCRPVCPARPARRDNVRFYVTAAAAEDAGFRPCLRCCPENAVRLPEWSLGNRTVVQGLRLIDGGLLDSASSADLAARLGVSQRHMDRLFRQALGATPKRLGLARRRQLAKRLLDSSGLPLSQVALYAGYGSIRRFNDDMRKVYGLSPRALRRAQSDTPQASSPEVRLLLPAREPFNVGWLLDFLQRRALQGLEAVSGGAYGRRITDRRGGHHWIRVEPGRGGVVLTVPGDPAIDLADVIGRVRRLFDLDADSLVIDDHLAADSRLAQTVLANPGLRVPGAWDGFETAVRAVLGQQVSVARATALGQRLMEAYGDGGFPTPEVLLRARPAELGMPGRRGEAISRLAALVASGELVLHEGADAETLSSQLCAIPGIGPWTAAYVSMRVARDPDAFPHGDWVVMKMLQATRAEARRLAEGWRPWRAYAVMYLWRRAAQGQEAGCA